MSHKNLAALAALSSILGLAVCPALALNINDPAPPFSGTIFNGGGTFSLSSHAGEVVVVAFNGLTWCSPCQFEAPILQALWQDFQGHGVQFVMIFAGPSTSGLSTAISTYGITMPVLTDQSIVTSWGVSGVPDVYILDRDHVIRDIRGGAGGDPAVFKETLRGEILDVVYMRDPVDTELVMDVSNSMNSPPPSNPGGDSKLVLMKQAASMVTDFLKDHGQTNDRLGLVWFSDNASEYVSAGDKLLSVASHATSLKNAINLASTGTCTAMGAGLQTALSTLGPSPQKPFVVLCTDGMQNIEPKVTAVGGHYEIIDSGGWLCGGHSSTPPQPGVSVESHATPVHTIGIGITATYSALLQDLAQKTGAFFQATNDPHHDLDLIYFVDLTNAMAGGSPSVVCHHTGRLQAEECEAIEYFHINRSARKVSVILSWSQSQKSQLTFWLYAPDGTRLPLHDKMKLFESYCLATFYVPWRETQGTPAHVGRWTMVIRGEIDGAHADYHAMVIVDDRDTKVVFDFPKRLYAVGDILPIELKVAEFDRQVVQVKDLQMEKSRLGVSLVKQLAEYHVFPGALRPETLELKEREPKAMLAAKLEAMERDPRIREALTPLRTVASLHKGTLTPQVQDGKISIPVSLDDTGLQSFKLSVLCQTERNGPIERTGRVSVLVQPGKVDPQRSSVSLVPVTRGQRAGANLLVTPRDARGGLIGPGYADDLQAMIGKQPIPLDVDDYLDGSYRLSLLGPAEKVAAAPVTVLFQNRPVWKGELPIQREQSRPGKD